MKSKIKVGIAFFIITWMGFSAVAGNYINPPLDFYPTIWLVALLPSALSFFIGYQVG